MNLTRIAANVLLTPFRVQNVPPPMSSSKITLASHAPSSSKRLGTPIHASFSSISDTLAILWEIGHVELYALHTRLQVGRGKAIDPSIVWSGQVDGDSGKQCRQIRVSSTDPLGTSSTLVVLSSDRGNDVVTIVDLEDYKTVKNVTSLPLPHRNCRLVADESNLTCQGPNGEILQCQYLPV
jgi:elongator complex protein 1